MNKILFILSTLLLASIANCTTKMLQDNGQSNEKIPSVECHMKLVNTYTGLDHGSRSSMIPSELIKSSCMGLDNSCCTDQEYEILNSKTENNLKRIHEGLSEVQNAIKLLPKESDPRIKELLSDDQSTDEDLAIIASFKTIKDNSTKLVQDLNNSFQMVTDFTAGYSCAICKSENHHNFLEGYEDHEQITKMIFDTEYCEDLFNSPLLLSTLEFYSQLNNVMTVTGAIGEKYAQHIKNDFENSAEQLTKINETRISCLASQNDLSKSNSCIELCFEMGKPNGFIFTGIGKQLASFTTVINDYFGDQSILKQMQNTSSEDNLQEKSFTDITETISVFVDKFNVKHILEHDQEHEELDLEHIKIHPVKGRGWNLHQTRRAKWEMFQSQSILAVSQILILILAITKMD